MKNVIFFSVCLLFGVKCVYNAVCGNIIPPPQVRITFTNRTNMNNEEKVETPVTASVPTDDSCDRLAAARKYATEQYDKLCSVAAEQMQHVRAYTEEARRQVNEGWDVTCSKAKDLHKAGEEFVKENPTSSMLGALGVGVVLGLLLGVSKR